MHRRVQDMQADKERKAAIKALQREEEARTNAEQLGEMKTKVLSPSLPLFLSSSLPLSLSSSLPLLAHACVWVSCSLHASSPLLPFRFPAPSACLHAQLRVLRRPTLFMLTAGGGDSTNTTDAGAEGGEEEVAAVEKTIRAQVCLPPQCPRARIPRLPACPSSSSPLVLPGLERARHPAHTDAIR